MERAIPATPDAQDRKTARITLDVVIPMYDEEAVLPELLAALAETFSVGTRKQHRIDRVCCLFIDDGSRDSSVSMVQNARLPGLDVRIIRLSRNFGHQAAVSAGIAHSSSDLVAVIDADLQDPPACILEMLDSWRSGFEVVYAQRRNRKEGWSKRLMYWAFYRLFRALSPVSVPVDSGDFCLMSRRVVEVLNQLPETVRFPRGLRSWIGFAQTSIAYDRPARARGTSRYGWRDLYRLATDGIASLSLFPLKLAQLLSLAYLILSVAGVAALLFRVFEDTDVHAQLTLILVVLLLSNSVILFCLYILGAYLGRAYLEVKGRPGYIVAEVIEAVADPTSETEDGW